jgi:hypothetical protein
MLFGEGKSIGKHEKRGKTNQAIQEGAESRFINVYHDKHPWEVEKRWML